MDTKEMFSKYIHFLHHSWPDWAGLGGIRVLRLHFRIGQIVLLGFCFCGGLIPIVFNLQKYVFRGKVHLI